MVNTPDTNRNEINPNLRKKFNGFLQSLSDVLIDITALEVNTMVVDHISGTKFIPWEAYRDIYPISTTYLERTGIHPSLWTRYLSLRKQIETEYCLYCLEEQLLEQDASQLREYVRILSDPTAELDIQKTKLPNPLSPAANPAIEINKIQDLLDDGRFLRSLRKVDELKAALDNRNKSLQKSEASQAEDPVGEVTTDMIYAQSIIQLDGDIINRYHQRLFEHEHKDIILDIHRQGVTAGEKQWHGLLEFMVDLVESLVNRGGSSIKDLFNNRN